MRVINKNIYVKLDQPVYSIESAFGSSGNPDKIQESNFASYKDECFVFSSAVSTVPNAEVAAHLSAETALWGYRHIRQRHYYWSDKHRLMFRIFKSTNIRLWQKTRDSGFEDGLAASMAVVIAGSKQLWLGTLGDCRVYVVRQGEIIRRSMPDVDEHGAVSSMIGRRRYDTNPHQLEVEFLENDTVVICNNFAAKQFDENTFMASDFSDRPIDEVLDMFLSTVPTGVSEIASFSVIRKNKLPENSGLHSSLREL